MYGVIAACLVFGRGIAQHELGAQLLGYLGIDVVHRVLLFGLEVPSPRLLGDALENLLAVGAIFLLPGIAPSRVAPAAGITATWVPTARITAAPSQARIVVVIVVLVAAYIDAVDDGFGLLTRFNGAVHGLLAAPVLSIGQDHDGLAAGLLFRDFIAGQKNGVVEFRACASRAPVRPRTLVAGGNALDQRLGVNQPHGLLQLGVIGGQVLQQLDLAIEVDHKGTIHRPVDHLVKKAPAGAALA